VSDPLFDRWGELQSRYDELNKKLVAGVVDSRQRHQLQKEISYLSSRLLKHKEILSLEHIMAENRDQHSQTADKELQFLYDDEFSDLKQKKEQLFAELDDLMFPPDDLDKKSAFLEIRAGAGGQEAALFAADLAKMYTNYALSRNWQVSFVSIHETDLKGFKEVVLSIEGKGVHGSLKFESGTHRVQRVPETETSGRIHTSTATVAVFPAVGGNDIVVIDPQDLRIDVFRAGGAGGQHVNKTESAVRITHLPTGVVVSCQDERSQHKNKAKAMKVLQSRLAVAQREQEDVKRGAERKKMVGTGMRAEKVRTYNFPQNRVTDHQVGLTLKKLDIVMAGELDEIIQALQEKERLDRRNQPIYIP